MALSERLKAALRTKFADDVISDLETDIATTSASEIAVDAVTETKILNGAVTENKIYTGAVTNTKLGADAVDNSKLADNAVSIENMDAACKPILLTVAVNDADTMSREENIAGLSSAIAEANSAKAKFNAHIASGGTGIDTVVALANDVKAIYNTHLAAGGTALAQAIAITNDNAAKYVAHIADAAEHKLADAVNVVTATNPSTDYATMIALATELLTIYDAHEGDAEAAGALTYHHAVEASQHSLASVVAPDTVNLAITRMNDFKAKFNSHDADAVSHTLGTTHQVTAANGAMGTAQHPVQADATNGVAAANATDLATSITLISEILTDYVLHDNDSELVADFAYHLGTEAGDHSLASAAAPTSLAECITRINDAKAKINAHIADTSTHGAAGTATVVADATVGSGEHPVDPDTTNTVTTADAADLTTLKALITELLTDYDAHEGDAELASAWVYHEAQEGGDHSLTSTAAPTTLQLCLTRLADFRSKYNAHDADATTHTTGSTQQVTISASAYGAVNRVPISGVAIGDTVVWNVTVAGTGTVTKVSATAGTGYIDFTFSADPQNDAVINYWVFRAAA